jgi:hypothetical protein
VLESARLIHKQNDLWITLSTPVDNGQKTTQNCNKTTSGTPSDVTAGAQLDGQKGAKTTQNCNKTAQNLSATYTRDTYTTTTTTTHSPEREVVSSTPAPPHPTATETQKILAQAGIGLNSPAMRELLALPHITAEYVRGHCERFRAEKLKQPQHTVGLLIRRLKDGDPLPPPPPQPNAYLVPDDLAHIIQH